MQESTSQVCAPAGEQESIVRVVAVEADRAWLEPEQGTSCGGCASAAACGAKGIGTLASRLEARRYAIGRASASGAGIDLADLSVGDRLVVAIDAGALLKAAGLAYGLPLAAALAAAIVAQEMTGSDGMALLAAVAGLAAGLGVMKRAAARMAARGALQPRLVRRADAVHTLTRIHRPGS